MCFYIQRAEDRIRFPVIITTSAIMVMMMNMRLLFSSANTFSFFPQSSHECFSLFFLTIPSCFDTYSRELDKELKRNGKEELPRLPNLGVFRPTGRCLPLGYTAATVLPLASLHSRPPLIRHCLLYSCGLG